MCLRKQVLYYCLYRAKIYEFAQFYIFHEFNVKKIFSTAIKYTPVLISTCLNSAFCIKDYMILISKLKLINMSSDVFACSYSLFPDIIIQNDKVDLDLENF